MSKKVYAIVGDSNYVICEPHLKRVDMIEMVSTNPDMDKYVAGNDGTWHLIDDYSQLRKVDILRNWPIDKQLEALTEAVENPPRIEKLEQLKTFLKNVKAMYPKQ